jgi:hypothetical protein
MIDTMHDAEGIGLAAQQIGRALQLCVVDLRASDADFTWELDGARPPLDLFMPLVIANPVVTVLPARRNGRYEEGCLSFPKIRGDIPRPDAITRDFSGRARRAAHLALRRTLRPLHPARGGSPQRRALHRPDGQENPRSSTTPSSARPRDEAARNVR